MQFLRHYCMDQVQRVSKRSQANCHPFTLANMIIIFLKEIKKINEGLSVGPRIIDISLRKVSKLFIVDKKKAQMNLFFNKPKLIHQARSLFITLFHAEIKSLANFS
jgi:hypothetical protein